MIWEISSALSCMVRLSYGQGSGPAKGGEWCGSGKKLALEVAQAPFEATVYGVVTDASHNSGN